MNRLWVVAWRNWKRKGSRAALLAASAAITAFILFVSYFFIFSMEQSVRASSQRLGADLLVVPKGTAEQAGDMLISGKVSTAVLPASIVDKLSTIKEIEAVAPQLYLKTVSTVCCGTMADYPVVAFDPSRDFTLKNWVVATERTYDKYDVIIGAKAGGDNYLYHYDDPYHVEWITLFDKQFKVRNVLFPTGMATDNTIFIDLRAAQEVADNINLGIHIPKNQISVALIKTQPGMDEYVKRQIYRMDLPVDVVKGSGLQEMVNRQILPIKLFSYVMITVMLVMSAFQVMTVFSVTVSERRKEIGMLRAMGATRGVTYQMLLYEAMWAALIGGGIGTLLGASLLYDNKALILKWFQLPLLFPYWDSGILIGVGVLAVVILITVGAAFLPIRQILKTEPYEAIREGEV